MAECLWRHCWRASRSDSWSNWKAELVSPEILPKGRISGEVRMAPSSSPLSITGTVRNHRPLKIFHEPRKIINSPRMRRFRRLHCANYAEEHRLPTKGHLLLTSARAPAISRPQQPKSPKPTKCIKSRNPRKRYPCRRSTERKNYIPVHKEWSRPAPGSRGRPGLRE